jgi:hypothetical protein
MDDREIVRDVSRQPSAMSRDTTLRPRQDSNLRTRLRRAALYPLSYGGWGNEKRISRQSWGVP